MALPANVTVLKATPGVLALHTAIRDKNASRHQARKYYTLHNFAISRKMYSPADHVAQ